MGGKRVKMCCVKMCGGRVRGARVVIIIPRQIRLRLIELTHDQLVHVSSQNDLSISRSVLRQGIDKLVKTYTSVSSISIHEMGAGWKALFGEMTVNISF